MIDLDCTHSPFDVRITYDVGEGKTKSYKLCQYCKEFSIFKKDVLHVENLQFGIKKSEAVTVLGGTTATP